MIVSSAYFKELFAEWDCRRKPFFGLLHATGSSESHSVLFLVSNEALASLDFLPEFALVPSFNASLTS